MRILHIVPTYIPAYRYGGPIESVHNLNKWLVKQGAEVTVYTTNVNGPENLEVPLGQPVVIDGVKVCYFPTNFLRGWYYSSAMRQALQKNTKDFDLVHITSAFLFASKLGACYAKKFNKPYVISPRGSLMSAPLKKSGLKKRIYIGLIEKSNLAGAAAVHFTTELEKKEYVEEKLPLNKSIIIPNGFDPEKYNLDVPRSAFREKFGIAKEKKIVLFLSRLSWKKGLDVLLPAFAEVSKKEPEAVLVLAGGDDENYKREVQKLIEKNSLGGRVIFTGEILGKDKIAAYRDADVFVLPSYAENFANVVLEAGYFSLPVVVSPEVGLSSDILKHKAGLVTKRETHELSEALLKILEDKKIGEELGKNGREMVLKEFSPAKVAENMLREYDAIIKEYGKN